jgi:hypothetical protein
VSIGCQGVVADVEARVWLTGADARRQVRVKREEVGRRLGAAAWLGVRASGGVGACPLPGVARTRARAALVRRRGQVAESGWKKGERERKIHGSTGQ